MCILIIEMVSVTQLDCISVAGSTNHQVETMARWYISSPMNFTQTLISYHNNSERRPLQVLIDIGIWVQLRFPVWGVHVHQRTHCGLLNVAGDR